MKAFAKYPDCFGKLALRELIEVARRNGMQVISAGKPNMHCHNEIGLYGTQAAMRKTEAEWRAAGHEPKPRNFDGVFGVDLAKPRDEWLEGKLGPVRAASTIKRLLRRTLPKGYRYLIEGVVSIGDLAWNQGRLRWERPEVIGLSAEKYICVARKKEAMR